MFILPSRPLFLWFCLVLLLETCGLEAARGEIPAELRTYVAKPDASFSWRLVNKQQGKLGPAYHLEMTSQTWQGIPWKHALSVFEPSGLRHPRHVLLWVSGGSNQDQTRPQDIALGERLAQLTGARVAVLSQVPNQPLFDGRKEDDLITETWLRYLRDGDSNWPLLFPMVKSAVRAMDAVQQLAREQWQGEVDGFVISGGSKRGWTSWLTAVVEPRLIATAPMVIDVLNFRAHMDQQLATWGEYSEQIADYTSKGLIKPGAENDRERHLREMMDPFTYLPVIEIPKLLVHGTNDPYWCVDATRFYWDQIRGPKYVLKLPNDGHGLETNRQLALSTLAVFFQHSIRRATLPAISWRQEQLGSQRKLVVTSPVQPVAAQLWIAHSSTKDFRQSRWMPQAMSNGGQDYLGSWERSGNGHQAYFGELKFESEGLPYSLCTLVYWE